MSAPENEDTRARLLKYARWGAIGLACLSALMIAVFSGTGALRVAAFFAVLAVVLVIVWVTLSGAASQKAHLEETLLEEIDMLREDVRADITTAARATHRAVAERVAHLHQNVDSMRREIDSRPMGAAPAPAQVPLAGAAPRRALPAPGPVVHTESVHVTTHYVEPDDAYPPRQMQRPDEGYDRYPQRSAERDQHGRDAGMQDAGMGAYGGDRRREQDDARPARRPAAREDARPDARRGPVPAPPAYEDEVEVAGWRGGGLARDDDPAEDPRWSGMRNGDRWAEVRTDERGGRELRMGERRTAIRSDETGTHMQIVDRWSTVRQEPAYPSSGAGYTGETRSERRRREEAEEQERRAEEDWRSGRSDRGERSDRARPALPSSGPESAAGWVRGSDGRAADSRSDDRGWSASESRATPGRAEGPRRGHGDAQDDSWTEGRQDRAEARDYGRPSPAPRSREISGEIVRDRGGADRGGANRAAPGRGGDQQAWPPQQGGQSWQGGGYDDRGRDERRDESRGRDGDRDDNRWERESSGGRSNVRHSLDFDHTDDRWR